VLKDIYKYIDDNMDRFVEEFREYLRIPTVAARHEGYEEGAAATEKLMKDAGIDGVEQLFPTTGGPAVLYGNCHVDDNKKTLLCYGHYDVQPEDPIDQWIVPPFSAEMIDGTIYARGATDNKGGVMAFSKAVEAFKQVRGQVPVNLKFLFEGEEEVGSPHLGQVCIEYGEKFECDGMHCLDGGVSPSKLSPVIELGLKGLLYVELICRGPKKDVYSGDSAMVENPVWRLVHALSTLFDTNGNITIDGWFDDYMPPTYEDLELIRAEVAESDEQTLLDYFGVKEFAYGKSLYEVLTTRHYGGTATINGIIGGYTGEGAKTIVPAEVKAKMDFRLPPNFNDEKQLKRLKDHLERRGYGDIEIRCLSSRGYPYKVPVSEDLAQVIIEAATEVFGNAPAVYGLTQEDIIRHYLGMPVVLTGFGPPKHNLHSPNENMTVEYLNKGIKYAAAIMYKYSLLKK